MEDNNVQKLFDMMIEMDKKLGIHIALDAETSETARENQRILKGKGDRTGLVAKVEKNTGDIRDIKKIAWAVMTPVLLAVGSGIVYLIVRGGSGFGG